VPAVAVYVPVVVRYCTFSNPFAAAPPLAAIVIEPAPFVTVIPEPAVIVAAVGVADVEPIIT